MTQAILRINSVDCTLRTTCIDIEESLRKAKYGIVLPIFSLFSIEEECERETIRWTWMN